MVKICLSFIILCFSRVTGMAETRLSVVGAAPVLSYADLTNHTSEFWQRFIPLKHAGRLCSLYAFGTLCQVHTTTFVISNVPALQAGPPTSLTAEITYDDDRVKIRLCDARGNECLEGSTVHDSGLVSLDTLNTNTKKEQRRLVSGNTIMTIWENICALCGFDAAEICDGSICNGFDLRILLPYVYGRSWYGKFGYFPKKLTLDEYKRILTFLTQRSCAEIFADFAHNATACVLLRLSLNVCQLPENAPIGALVKKLYHGMRMGALNHEDLLRSLYARFLSSYSSSDTAHHHCIEGQQRKIYAQHLFKYCD